MEQITKRQKQRSQARINRMKKHALNNAEIMVIAATYSEIELQDLMKRLKKYGLKG